MDELLRSLLASVAESTFLQKCDDNLIREGLHLAQNGGITHGDLKGHFFIDGSGDKEGAHRSNFHLVVAGSVALICC